MDVILLNHKNKNKKQKQKNRKKKLEQIFALGWN